MTLEVDYHLDLYPADDPRDGDRIRRLAKRQSAEVRGSANGTGSGRFSTRGTSADAAVLDPEGLQYTRVVRELLAVDDGSTLSGHDEKVVAGIWLEHGDFDALTERRKQLLTFGGAGTLGYLDRERMWSHTYMDVVGAMDPFDRIWRLYAAGGFSGGNKLGGMYWRAMSEGLRFQSGAYHHRHADGLNYFDTHDDDKLESAIGFVTLGFDQFVDSDGTPWALTSGDFVAQIGESLLSVTKRLMEAGLYIELDPDTFELRAWEAGNHGRDRTGLAWGADVLRFQAPTDPLDIATGNILDEAKRAVAARRKRTQILAGGGEDIYAVATDAGGIPWHGFFPSDVADAPSLEAMAERQIAAQNLTGDAARFPFPIGDDPENGAYLPFEHVLFDDLATIHSGSLTWDWDEAALPVAGLILRLKAGGDWQALADLGSAYTDMRTRAFQDTLRQIIRQPHAHPEPCRRGTTEGPFIADYGQSVLGGTLSPAWVNGGSGTGGLTLTIPADDPNRALYAFVLARHDHSVPTVAWSAGGGQAFAQILGPISAFGSTGTMYVYRLLDPNDGAGAILASTGIRVGAVYLTNLNQSDPEADSDVGNPVGTSISLSVAGGDLTIDSAGWANANETAPDDPTSSSTELWSDVFNGGGGFDDSAFVGSHGDSTPTHTSGNSRMWVGAALALNGTGTPGDAHNDLVGTGTRYSRCGHSHHVLRDDDPTVNDDADAGYPVTTLWTNTDTGDSFLLTDGAAGAAVWAPFGGGNETLPESIIDAKGDLIAGTAADTADVLPVGPDGAGLVPDSGETTGLRWRKHNDAASAAPTVNDDSGDGYEVGSHWLDETNEKEYVCLDATVAAAVWKERTNVSGGGATIVVREVAGTDIEDVAELEFDASDFVVTEPSAGVARVELAAPGGSGALVLLSHTVLGSAAADITATGLSGSYKDLVIVVRGRSTDAGAGIGLDLRVGSGSIDTGSNYSYLQSYTGWATGANGSTGATLARIGSIPNSGATAGSFGVCTIEIINYVDAAKWRGWVGQAFAHDGSGTLRSEVGGFWKNAANALDQVRVLGSAGNLDTGSALTIYGRG